MIKKSAQLIVLFSLVFSLIAYALTGSQPVALTCWLTGVLLTVNLLGLFLFWKIVIHKKSIALGVLLIVFKYPLLGFAVWNMAHQPWFNNLGLVFGFMSFIIAIITVALLKHFNKLN